MLHEAPQLSPFRTDASRVTTPTSPPHPVMRLLAAGIPISLLMDLAAADSPGWVPIQDDLSERWDIAGREGEYPLPVITV